MGDRIRVLIVDDSAVVRQILKKGLEADPDIEVVGAAPDPFAARDMLVRLKPDVMTLDVEMPKMDGVEFLRRLMPQHPLPVVMVSSLTRKGQQITLDALAAGALDFVAKPASNLGRALPEMMGELCEKVKIASRARVSALKTPPRRASATVDTKVLKDSTDKVVAIGASTGGTEALRAVLQCFPRTMPGVVVVQHMPPGFTRSFADQLDGLCPMFVKEADDGDRILPGRVLIAPGDHHLMVKRVGGFYQVAVSDEERVSGHRPSVDVLMDSMAKHVGDNGVGAVLTGMGRDGANGLLAFKNAGGRTIVQDEATSVVYGMPKVAWELGAADEQVPLDKVAERILKGLG